MTREGYHEDVTGKDGLPIETWWHLADARPSLAQKEQVASAVARYIRAPRGLAVPRDKIVCDMDPDELLLTTATCLPLARFKFTDSGKLTRLPPEFSIQGIAIELFSRYGVDTPLEYCPILSLDAMD